MGSKDFTKAWDELSDIQRKVASWEEGSLLVLAGPGSGKTRVLTCRIARLLDTTIDKNFRVLGLTFTNKAADEMRDRVAKFVPGQEGRLFLSTFHSFCADVLRQHGTHIGVNPNFNIYAQDVELQSVLNAVVEEAKKKSDLITDLDKKTLPVIQRLKTQLVPVDKCRDFIRDKDLGKRLSIIYPAYETELSRQNALDFNSLIFKAYQLFEKYPAFAKRYRTVYPFICIDEFQDTNYAQYMLIRAITDKDNKPKNLLVVADDDQIIYQWNGASHKRIHDFISDYSPTIMQLPMNYRCPPEIITLANNLITNNFLRTEGKKPLKASRSSTGKEIVRLLPQFDEFEAEASGIAKDIKKRHSKQYGSVVILGRNRRLLDGVEKALRKEGIPAVIAQRRDEFESTPFIWLHSVLRLANDRQDQSSLEAICGSFAQLTQLEVDSEEVIAQAKTKNRDYLQHWIKIALEKTTDNVIKEVLVNTSRYLGEGRDFNAFSNFALSWFETLIKARKQSEDDPTAEVFARYAEERVVWQNLMREILQSLGDAITLEAFLQELQMHSKEPTPKPSSTILMTIHSAKGKEFDHVYIVGLVEDELPSFQSKQKGDNSPEMEEERRNCFVAITRTIKTLTLSYAERYRGWGKEPSRFLYEMGLLDS